jgi:hypothetical protein
MSTQATPPDALASLQHEFQAYVLHRAPAVLERVRATGTADASARMDVYADGYVLRLLEAMQTDYPGLLAIAGDGGFDEFGRAYIASHPSTLRNLRWYGDGLAAFLASTPPWSARRELADMARFEWAMGTAFDAPDATGLSRGDLAAVDPGDWPRLTFTVHPAVRTVALETNVTAAWSAQARGEPLPALRAEKGVTTWLLTRRELQVRFRAMTPAEAAAFDRLSARASFAQWCAELGEAVGEQAAAAQAVQLLGQWLADGALAGFALEPD